MGKKRNVFMVLLGKPEDKDHLKQLLARWKIILKQIFQKEDMVAWTGLIWLGI